MNVTKPPTVQNADEAEAEAGYRVLLLTSYALSLCVSTAALISLVFTLWIFLRRRDATAGARGMVLLIVTGLFTAMSLTILYVVNIDGLGPASGRNSSSEGRPRALDRFMEAQYVITNTSLLLRNWWVTFLTLVRFVVILFPLRVPELLTRKRQMAAFFSILAASAAISIVRYLEEKTCTAHAVAAEAAAAASASAAPGGIHGNSTDSAIAVAASCESFIIFFFVMQTGVPVPTVLVLSVALAVHLCAAREPSDEVTSTAVARQQSGHGSRQKSAAKSRGRCRKRKATRILLALAVTFTVLELPTFVYFIMMHFFPNFRCASPSKARLIFSGLNALITLDTLANFFIFFVFSESFKREVTRCGGCRDRGASGPGVTGVRCNVAGCSSELRPMNARREVRAE